MAKQPINSENSLAELIGKKVKVSIRRSGGNEMILYGKLMEQKVVYGRTVGCVLFDGAKEPECFNRNKISAA
jgi:hypothetical protein